MSPTLLPGDCLYVDPRAYADRPPARGDLVVVRDPLLPARNLVKRVGYVPGETASPEGIVVPNGTVYLLGDAPARSRDSRSFGPVPVDAIVGRAYRCYRPMDHRRTL
jgi:type IV secretory pathway protease TraF